MPRPYMGSGAIEGWDRGWHGRRTSAGRLLAANLTPPSYALCLPPRRGQLDAPIASSFAPVEGTIGPPLSKRRKQRRNQHKILPLNPTPRQLTGGVNPNGVRKHVTIGVRLERLRDVFKGRIKSSEFPE